MNDRAHRILAGVIMAAICGIVIHSSSFASRDGGDAISSSAAH